MVALAASALDSDPPLLLSGPVLGSLAEAGFFFGLLLVTYAAMESVEGSEVWSLSLHRFVPLFYGCCGLFLFLASLDIWEDFFLWLLRLLVES